MSGRYSFPRRVSLNRNKLLLMKRRFLRQNRGPILFKPGNSGGPLCDACSFHSATCALFPFLGIPRTRNRGNGSLCETVPGCLGRRDIPPSTRWHCRHGVCWAYRSIEMSHQRVSFSHCLNSNKLTSNILAFSIVEFGMMSHLWKCLKNDLMFLLDRK